MGLLHTARDIHGPDGTSDDYEEPLFGLWRDEFHEGNYNAADRHVCDWIVYDLSCYSGQTPMAIDELDNHGGTATCAQPSIVNCKKHAGWELDIAEGTSPCTTTSTGVENADAASSLSRSIKDASSVEDMGRRLADAMNKTIEDQAIIKGAGMEARTSYYMGRGYKMDLDPLPPKEHPHGGY
jgi:hypothetical protein